MTGLRRWCIFLLPFACFVPTDDIRAQTDLERACARIQERLEGGGLLNLWEQRLFDEHCQEPVSGGGEPPAASGVPRLGSNPRHFDETPEPPPSINLKRVIEVQRRELEALRSQLSAMEAQARELSAAQELAKADVDEALNVQGALESDLADARASAQTEADARQALEERSAQIFDQVEAQINAELVAMPSDRCASPLVARIDSGVDRPGASPRLALTGDRSTHKVDDIPTLAAFGLLFGASAIDDRRGLSDLSACSVKVGTYALLPDLRDGEPAQVFEAEALRRVADLPSEGECAGFGALLEASAAFAEIAARARVVAFWIAVQIQSELVPRRCTKSLRRSGAEWRLETVNQGRPALLPVSFDEAAGAGGADETPSADATLDPGPAVASAQPALLPVSSALDLTARVTLAAAASPPWQVALGNLNRAGFQPISAAPEGVDGLFVATLRDLRTGLPLSNDGLSAYTLDGDGDILSFVIAAPGYRIEPQGIQIIARASDAMGGGLRQAGVDQFEVVAQATGSSGAAVELRFDPLLAADPARTCGSRWIRDGGLSAQSNAFALVLGPVATCP